MRGALLHTAPRRVALETALLAVGFVALSGLSRGGVSLSWIGTGAPLCMLWAVLRLRIAPRLSWRLVAVDALLSLVWAGGALLLLGGGVLSLARLLGQSLAIGWFEAGFLLAFNAGAFGAGRVGLRIVLVWLRLREQRYIWSLTHTILLAALLVASPFVLLLVAVQLTSFLRGADEAAGVILRLLPLLALIVVSAVAVLIVVLPAALTVAFFFARRMTRRLQALASATTALSAGDYAARVPVVGVDEIAQLQGDFNTMAADLQQAMADLQAERDRVTGLLQAQRGLVANVSHDLRTPVATLRGYLDSALRGWQSDPPPTLHDDLQVMQREVLRLQALIDDLFTLSRAEVGKLALRTAPTDVGALAREAVATLAPLAWQSGRVELVADVPPDLPLALSDAARWQQVLQNLLHNAVRHTPPGGIVAVVARAEGPALVFEVRDTGEGIAPEALPHVWERFYRAGERADRGTEGAGLGLAIVKELTEAMGGSVEAESVRGEGSCFRVRLPSADRVLLAST